jgi:hypothetical protein
MGHEQPIRQRREQRAMGLDRARELDGFVGAARRIKLRRCAFGKRFRVRAHERRAAVAMRTV